MGGSEGGRRGWGRRGPAGGAGAQTDAHGGANHGTGEIVPIETFPSWWTDNRYLHRAGLIIEKPRGVPCSNRHLFLRLMTTPFHDKCKAKFCLGKLIQSLLRETERRKTTKITFSSHRTPA